MNEELKKKLKFIHLTWLLEKWDQYIEIARKKDLSHVKLLEYVIEEEYQQKIENSRKLRLVKAKIPERLLIETFPFDRQPKLNKKKILSIYDSFGYMEKHENVIWIGPTGAGKSGLATAFLIHAVNRGYKGRFIPFPELVDVLHKSMGDYSEKEVLKRFADYDCLLIDEVGYVEVEPAQVGLFFTLMQKRYKNKTTLITSNIGFGQWSSFLKNDNLTAALIDRLTENSHVINMKECVSLRSKLI